LKLSGIVKKLGPTENALLLLMSQAGYGLRFRPKTSSCQLPY